MRILIAPVDIAGQGNLLARELNRRGYHTEQLIYNQSKFKYPLQGYLRLEKMPQWFRQNWGRFDIFHYYWGKTMFKDLSDLNILAQNKKKVLMRHCGNDVRLLSLAKQKNPWIQIIHPHHQTETEMVKHLQRISAAIEDAIVPDYELYEHAKRFYKKVHVIPRMIETKKYRPLYPDPHKRVPLVVHAPSIPSLKGTSYIEKAVHELKKKHHFTFRMVQNMPHTQALQIYRQADIIVDQLLIGTHGILAMEAMALGKPVISYIREDLQSTFPRDFPILSANPDTIIEKLDWLLSHPNERRRLGKIGRVYTVRVHDVSQVVPQMIRVYNQCSPAHPLS
ncbi:glycosyltransferase involved in cell wall biosynthesis [Kroppenstedtia sanguinis]|uniref:glycosyltransferase n=1 Tax=Kroppenstedtia sanguinis TaxID=1380684 RepID=UPI003D1B02FE